MVVIPNTPVCHRICRMTLCNTAKLLEGSKQISQNQMISCLYLTYVCFTDMLQIIALCACDIALVLVIRMLNSGADHRFWHFC